MNTNLKSELKSGSTRVVDFTAGQAYTAGDPIQLGVGLFGIVATDVADGARGTAHVNGEFEGRKVSGILSVGGSLYWDAEGDPYTGTAGTGAFTSSQGAGDYFAGTIVETTSATATSVRFLLNKRRTNDLD